MDILRQNNLSVVKDYHWVKGMNLWQKTVLENLLAKRVALFKWLVTFLLVLSLTSCGEKAVSQNISNRDIAKPQLISKQFSEVAPPATIQTLRTALDVYQPQVTILTPQTDEIFQDSRVTVSLQVKDLPIFKAPELELGPHLEVILDNQAHKTVYDLNQPLVLSDLSPGTHTLRVFASRPGDESFKNEGAFAQTTFHIFAKTEDNNPDPSLPLLTYNRPRGNYGAEPILLDFYLTNAPLHLVNGDNPQNEISDWRIRCTINDESFVFDRWQAIYLKGFKPGKNWVKLEFLDNQGNPVKNAFNTTVGVFTYEPKGKDSVARIVRGELSADEVRSIVDPNYSIKIQPTEAAPRPTPTVTPEVEKIPQVEPKKAKSEAVPTPTVTPEVKHIPQVEPQEEKKPIPEIKVKETPTVAPYPSLTPETQPEVTPTPEATKLPEKVAPKPDKHNKSKDFQRSPSPVAQPSPTPEA